MILVKESLSVYLAKMVADITVQSYSSLIDLVVGTSVETIVAKYDGEGLEPIKNFLLDNGVGKEVVNKFSQSFVQTYYTMDFSLLPYYYFLLPHVQKTLRANILNKVPQLRSFVTGYIGDSEWTLISNILGEFFKKTSFPLIPKEQSAIMGYYMSQLRFAILNSDLLEAGLGKTGLDTEIGDSTLTPLHNQTEIKTESSTRDDLPEFDKLSQDIYMASYDLFNRKPQGRDTYVYFDIVSLYKYEIMEGVKNTLSREIKRITKGLTRYAPEILVQSLVDYYQGASPNVIDDMDNRVKSRMASLSKVKELLKGVSSPSVFIDAMQYHYQANNAGGKTDGKAMYREYPFESPRVASSMVGIFKAYGALKKIIDFCEESDLNIMTIPTVAFRKPGMSKNFTTLREYIQIVELTEMLDKEMSEANSDPRGMSEHLLHIRDRLRGVKLSDVFSEEDRKLLEDLTFVVDYHYARGQYSEENYRNDPYKYKVYILFKLLRQDSFIGIQVWDAMKNYNKLEFLDEYRVRVPEGKSFSDIFAFYAEQAERSPKFFSNSKLPWNDPVKMEPLIVDKIYPIIAEFCSVGADVSPLVKMCVVMQTQSLKKRITEVMLNSFIRKVFKSETSTTLTVTDKGYVLRDSSEIFRVYSTEKELIRLAELPTNFSDKLDLLADLGVYPEYNSDKDDHWMRKVLVRAFDVYVKEYKSMFDLVGFLYRTYVAPIYSLFTRSKFAIMDIPYNTLVKTISGLYDPPNNNKFTENPGYARVVSHYTKDEQFGLFMDSQGKGPLLIRDPQRRPTFLHDSGHLLHVTASGDLVSTPITLDTEIRV